MWPEQCLKVTQIKRLSRPKLFMDYIQNTIYILINKIITIQQGNKGKGTIERIGPKYPQTRHQAKTVRGNTF